MGSVANRGKRVGPRKRRGFSPTALLLALGITLCVIAWGYLVKAAIDFGIQARDGTQDAWMFLGAAALGAVLCLFVGLMLIARLLRVLGITSEPAPAPPRDRSEPRAVGGHRSR
jgi:hypothetical protein